MEFKEYMKKIVRDFFMIQAGINIAIGTIGMVYPGQVKLSPMAFFMPFIYAFFCILPSFILYSPRELGIKQMLFRKVVHFFLLEAIVLSLTYFVKALTDSFIVVSIFIAVFVVCLFVTLADYIYSKTQADKMTEKLKKIKETRILRE